MTSTRTWLLCAAAVVSWASVGCGRTAIDDLAPPSTVDGGALDAAVPTQWSWTCPRADPGEPVVPSLAFVSDGQLVLMMSDRSTRVLHTFAPSSLVGDLPAGGGSVLSSRGRIVASATFRARVEGTFVQTDELVAMTTSGERLWSRSYRTDDLGPPHSRTIPLWLGADGVFALNAEPGHHALIWPDGREDALADVTAIERPMVGGLTPVWSSAEGWRWYEPGSGALTPFLASPIHTPVVAGEQLVYLAADHGVAALFVETGTSAERITLQPSVATTPPINVSLSDHTPAGWLLVSEQAGWEIYNVVTRERQPTAASFALPDGFVRFGDARLDFDGALLMPLRNDHWAALFRLDPESSEWHRIGRRLAEIDSLHFAARAGSYTVVTHGNNDLFVPTTTWAPAPSGEEPELLNTSVQVLRPETAIAFEWGGKNSWHLDIAPNGKCVVYSDQAGGGAGAALTLLDLESGDRTVLRETSAAPAWVDHQ